ncbi:hypothetical protein CYK25_009110 [Varibaculum cambriense]|nr:hypothetical protein CYK25_009110 [Varibaculum cambriense]
MTRAGLQMALRSQLEYADNWWNSGQNAATPIMSEPDRLHVFSSAGAARAGQGSFITGVLILLSGQSLTGTMRSVLER